MKLVCRFVHSEGVATQALSSACALMLTMLLPEVAHGQCTQGSAGTPSLMISIASPITVARDAAVGSVIGQGTATVAFNSAAPSGVHCTTDASAVYANLQGGGSSGSNNVMPIGATGIGYTLQANGRYFPTGARTLPVSLFEPTSCNQAAGGKCYAYLGPTITMQLVKLSPLVSSQTLPAGPYFSTTVGGLNASTVSLANPVQIANQTCTVTTPSIGVSLGNVPLGRFHAVGSTSDTVPFQIGLNCAGVTTNYSITFTDNNHPANYSNVLSLASGSSASGVGIQIVKDGSPVSFGPDSSAAGNLHQMRVGSSAGSGSVVGLPFGGRYVKTGNTITAGSANGVATFTMSYQ
ncbi:fimbrial protein [Paraburkholderia atlantica]|uniref:fimbrial protein n=1 Tax=Paraburkholderia atlantica TaxID=2654982 RepID=UPI0015901F50|nr:fimbrial protein [Paraburkholderia atlantica]MBB5418443.1 type 1 fimbria pilin [Paraburkholderia atlantica]